jgi:hypothetical protein
VLNPLPTRQRVVRRIAALDLERSTWLHHWKEINRVLLPRTGRFFELQQPSGRSARNEILDNTATKALGTLAAGMQTGLTSPARPWFKLETADADLMNSKAVSSWLDLVTQKLLAILAARTSTACCTACTASWVPTARPPPSCCRTSRTSSACTP